MKSSLRKSLVNNNRSQANLNNNSIHIEDQNKGRVSIISHNSNANLKGSGSQNNIQYVGKGQNPFTASVKNKSNILKKERPNTALASGNAKNNFFAVGSASPRDYGQSQALKNNSQTMLSDERNLNMRNAINQYIKPKQQSNKIDSLAVHFNKKTKIMNHPHHNFNGYGQAGDWGTMNKVTYF